MIKLFDKKIEKKINIKVLSLTKKYTRQLISLYFSFYNWREITRIRAKTDELLTELGII